MAITIHCDACGEEIKGVVRDARYDKVTLTLEADNEESTEREANACEECQIKFRKLFIEFFRTRGY